VANPTTNYGFVLPTASDLVTDLPADFDVALQGVDTRLKALQPGTTLGDLAYSSATANTNTRLGIGSTGNVLTVAAGVPTWSAPAAAVSGFNKVTSAAFSAVASVELQSIFTNTYKRYMVILSVEPSTNNNQFSYQYMYSTNTVESSANYYGAGNSIDRTNTNTNWGYVGGTAAVLTSGLGSGNKNLYYLYFNNVGNASEQAVYFGNSFNMSPSQSTERFGGFVAVSRTYTGIKLSIASGTISGDYQVFGVQN